MPRVYQHGIPSITNEIQSSIQSTNDVSESSNQPIPECYKIDSDRPFSLLTNPGNVFNDRLVYDIPTTAFRPSNDPIDDRIRKNQLIIDWSKRLDTHLVTKYSFEASKSLEQMEIYIFLSSLVMAREAVNFLTILNSNTKSIFTEYYSSIRDIYAFLREAGEERYPCMIQIAVILMTLSKHRIVPINPTWGFIRTPKVDIGYGLASQVYTIKTQHIIVMQSSTNFIRQRDDISDITFYNIFASAVGLNRGKYNSIVEWLVLNCSNYTEDKHRKYIKPPFTSPLTNQSLGSLIFIEGMSETMSGILLSNNATFCSVLITDGHAAYVEHNVQKALVTVAPPSIKIGKNILSVY